MRAALLAACRPTPRDVASAAATRRRRRIDPAAARSSGASLQNVWYGLSLGSVLLLAAIGLAITFGVMGVINMAHGEMVMLGAYTTYRRAGGDPHPHPGLFDIAVDRDAARVPRRRRSSASSSSARIIRFLYGRPLETLLATWGLSLVLQQAVRTHLRPEQPRGRRPVVDERRASSSAASRITYNRL